MTEEGKYQYGFGNVFSTEAIPDTLPKGQNNPQRCPFNLYAEQLSGTAFTVERSRNMFTWMYRIRPSVCHGPFMPQDSVLGSSDRMVITPNQLRWNPFSIQTSALQHNFIDGLKKICSSGNPSEKAGLSISVYRAGKSMSPDKRVMMNSDGDLLIVPQQGTLHIRTELGRLSVEPNEIVVIPRGIKFSVDLSSEEPIRGYVLEIYKGHFELPSLGAIGANGLANRRDFLYPVASFEDSDEPHLLVNKFMDNLFEAHIDHSPFDVVAWSGNYSPYKYDLRKFCVINTVSYDHLDPSIFTVLTCPSEDPGTATADFVIFPPRWIVAENTFRPPYFHRNCMTEFMGMIWGKYDAKQGFSPGGASLHSCMTAHGPDCETFLKATEETGIATKLEPVYFDQGLAFMFECNYMLKVADWALDCEDVDRSYASCWSKLPKLFTSS